jgi:hypothetical protein
MFPKREDGLLERGSFEECPTRDIVMCGSATRQKAFYDAENTT